MAPLTLDSLPVELVELIAFCFDIKAACNLRLAGRDIAIKSSGGVFRANYYTKTVKLSDEDQQRRFVKVTQGDQFGCSLQHLTLIDNPVSNN